MVDVEQRVFRTLGWGQAASRGQYRDIANTQQGGCSMQRCVNKVGHHSYNRDSH